MESFVDFNRERFDHRNEERHVFKAPPGLNEDVVRKISQDKDEPDWMLQKRLKALKLYKETPIPNWGPDLSGLDLEDITYYIRPDAQKNARDWDDVPDDIKDTFERLGIPQAERKALGGAGAQYESEVVYHNLKEDLEEQGVVFLDMDQAVQEYPELVKQHFMTSCIPINDHKFIMLHAAVWSGGTFIYVPEGVEVDIPLQAYFRMNSEKMGQFEHTLIVADKNAEVHYIEGCSAPQYTESSIHAGCVEIFVGEGARVRYSSVENWSKNTYNLNTKRALVDKNGTVEWISGNLGSKVTMLYPCSMLRGEGSKADHLTIAFGGPDQDQDTGAKIYHLAPHTSSTITSKSLSAGGGTASYRGILKIVDGAHHSKANVECDALLFDDESETNTWPNIEIDESNVDVGHEATVGKISDDQLYYLMSRGLDEEEAMKMIVSGFIEPITKKLPLEYAVELNRLIELEMEGSVG
jgi:Fe-S cluster assembly protein SufB